VPVKVARLGADAGSVSIQDDQPNGAQPQDREQHPEQTSEGAEYFVLAYDTASMRVVAFTGHGHDFVGAALALTQLVHEHRHDPHVRVRLEAAASIDELWRRDPLLFTRLRFPESGSEPDAG